MAHKQSLVGINVFPFVLSLTLKYHSISKNISNNRTTLVELREYL